jgi:hypothetical protein
MIPNETYKELIIVTIQLQINHQNLETEQFFQN